ncbi:hypothetical protein Sango_3042000 [Sesamum angolense]|uniref:Reverse transcriptase domain-containing protein n=1 Tax=Sesamum angolense TaxID=2727404 RepID=A0AAE1W0N7_9LAMI|nr:hypothetical protein Sango_3042000 [Sesamum angolense]
MEEVLEGGPWLYLGQPIVLQKWESGMVLLASGIGRPLYPDAITRACTRLDFARVCVMLNVSSKLPKHIVIMMPNEHGGESACKVDVESLQFRFMRKNQTPVPAPKTGDQIPNPDPVFDQPVDKNDMMSNERPHKKTDKGKQIVTYNAFDILRDAEEDADEMIRVLTHAAPRMFPHVEHSDLECSGLNRRDHQAAVRDLVSEFRLHFIALLETRVMPSNVSRVHAGLLPRWRWFTDYSGPGNRIWIAWNDDFIDVDILNIGSQFVHCRVLKHDMHEPIFLTVVYGANEVSARLLDMSEVSGASGDIRVAMHEFNDCIIQTGLISLPMQGERFSWHNCSTDGRSLWKRLDRMFVNDAWLERWPNLFYTCLTPRTSDHSPLVLKGDSRDVKHPVIGTPMYSVTRKLKALKPVFRQQRRKKGDLAMNVKLAAGFLEIAQKLLQADRHNSLLLQLENCCRLVYLKATQLEHVMLRQRAKLQWLKGGDQCSKVFFRRVATRRANKRLFQISDSDGLVQTDPTIINSVFVTYFQDLLGGIEERVIDLHYLRPWARHILTEEEAYALIRPVLLMMLKKLCLTLRRTKHQGQMVFPQILVCRFREILDLLISPSQNAFVPGRLISDNVLLAQELFSGYNQCRLPPRCALKVDLRKAYDTVEWDFLFATLRLFGFPAVFIRQGDPMSPYLFVLVMEVLQMILQQFIDQDGQFLYHWRCTELKLFQLSFADDLLLCKADVQSEGHLPVRYLGLPLISARLSIADCQPLLQKIDSRIKGWEGVQLSFAGRVQLIKSVLVSLEVYWAMAFILPKGIINEMIKRLRTFLWKGTSSSGYPKVAWEVVCRPIDEGGQGIKDIFALNRALMSKHLWAVIKQDRTSIWVDWIFQVRLRDCSIWTVKENKGAWGWRKMLTLRHTLFVSYPLRVGMVLLSYFGMIRGTHWDLSSVNSPGDLR